MLWGLLLREQCRERHAEGYVLLFGFYFLDKWSELWGLSPFCHPSHPTREGIPGNYMTDSQSFQNSRVQAGNTAEASWVCVEKGTCSPESQGHTSGFLPNPRALETLHLTGAQLVLHPSPPSEMGRLLVYMFPQRIFQGNDSV